MRAQFVSVKLNWQLFIQHLWLQGKHSHRHICFTSRLKELTFGSFCIAELHLKFHNLHDRKHKLDALLSQPYIQIKMLSSFLDTVYIWFLTHNFRNFSVFPSLVEIFLLLDVFYCAYLWAKTSAFLGKLLLLSNIF